MFSFSSEIIYRYVPEVARGPLNSRMSMLPLLWTNLMCNTIIIIRKFPEVPAPQLVMNCQKCVLYSETFHFFFVSMISSLKPCLVSEQ